MGRLALLGGPGLAGEMGAQATDAVGSSCNGMYSPKRRSSGIGATRIASAFDTIGKVPEANRS